MEQVRAFEALGNTVNIAATNASQQVALTLSGSGNRAIRIVNSGSLNIFWTLGTSSSVTAATATSTPMLANTVETFFLRNEYTNIAVISTASGNTVYITTGESA